MLRRLAISVLVAGIGATIPPPGKGRGDHEPATGHRLAHGSPNPVGAEGGKVVITAHVEYAATCQNAVPGAGFELPSGP